MYSTAPLAVCCEPNGRCGAASSGAYCLVPKAGHLLLGHWPCCSEHGALPLAPADRSMLLGHWRLPLGTHHSRHTAVDCAEAVAHV